MLFPLYCNRSVWDSKDFLVVVVVGFFELGERNSGPRNGQEKW